MTKIHVETTSNTLSHQRAKKRYGNWSAEYTFGVEGVSLNKDAYFSPHEFEVPYEVNTGDVIFVLSMTYSSGDSFGTSRGHGSVLYVFKDKNLATEAAKLIRQDEDAYTFNFKTEDGSIKEVRNPASGYFEHITTVSLQGFIVSNSDLDLQEF
jgi:hypothetical protein